jgi:beta-barrel assembly-enhancing protease
MTTQIERIGYTPTFAKTALDCMNAVEDAVCLIANKSISLLNSIFNYAYTKNPATGNRELWFIPTWAEKLTGYIYYAQYCNSAGGLSTTNRRIELVKEVGSKLAQYAPRNKALNYEFKLIDSRQINAWAMPGGKIAIYERMLKEMEKEDNNFEGYEDITLKDKVAAVLSHEIIHSAARHTAKRIEKVVITLFLVTFIRVFVIFKLSLNAFAYAPTNASIIGQIFKKFKHYIGELILSLYAFAQSRNDDFEADKYGMHLMQKSGYNPKAALWLQELFIKRDFPLPFLLKWKYFFYTHPTPTERLEANKKTLLEINS